jgi:hypothetical protein
MNLQEQIHRIKSVMGAIKELSETTDDVVGKEFWFEYHCFESPKSCDTELWYRTHNKVLVLSIVELGCGDTKLERLLEGCPRVYRVVFEDGFEYDVFEDELMESKEEFERPDAPKRNQQEQISRIQSMMGAINESDIPLIIRRRVSAENIEEAFESALDRMGGSMENPNSVIYKEKGTTLRLFAKFVIDEMVTYLEQDYFTDDNRIYFEDDDFYYDKIRKPLLRHYGSRIKERYYEII